MECRLGKQLRITNTYTPFKIDSLSEERIIDIACNSYNCLALTDSGKVNNNQNIEIIMVVLIC